VASKEEVLGTISKSNERKLSSERRAKY